MQLILFDIDNTIVNRDKAFLNYVKDLISRYPKAFGDNALEIIIKKDNGGKTKRKDFCTSIVKTFPGLKMTPEQLWEDHKKLPSFVEPDAKIKNMLVRISSKYKTACVTNGSSYMQNKKLFYSGLNNIFPKLFISGELNISKPSKEIFLKALNWAKADPKNTIMIGDSIENDIIPASKLGITTILVSDKPSEHAHHTINSILDAEKIINV